MPQFYNMTNMANEKFRVHLNRTAPSDNNTTIISVFKAKL